MNLIYSQSTRSKTSLHGERVPCCSRKLVSRPKTILSKSLEVQEVGEMGLYEKGESESFPGLKMGMIVDCFQVDGKV